MQQKLDRPRVEEIREFVIAAHGDLEKVKRMLATQPELLNAAQPWSETDRETAIQAAAQMGNTSIVGFLLDKGAPLDICTAAMLGRRKIVESLLAEHPDQINATGAHGIPLLTHASLSGDPELVQFLFRRGATTGASSALHNAVSKGNVEVAKWLLRNAKPDLTMKNFQGKTVLNVATERNLEALKQLLRDFGAEQ